jgi:hypothetical protein
MLVTIVTCQRVSTVQGSIVYRQHELSKGATFKGLPTENILIHQKQIW